jgi:ankyrin repeat protein
MLLHIHGDVAWMVGVVLTLDVRQKYLISDVTIRRFMGRSCSLIEYLSDELYSASEKGEVEAVRSLITAGADVNVKMWEGSALGRSEVVLLLLKAGARINFQNQRGHSALMRAACNGYSVVVSLLLKEGANTDLLTDDGDSALMMASSKGDNDVVSLLLGAGANIDPQNKMGESSLMIATKNGKTEIVSKLVKARAALDLKTNGGDSAVIFATAYCYLPVLKELVRAGADLNLCNQEGLTALMISSRSGTTDLTETLLTGKGISLDVQTDNGWSALFFAVDKGDVAPAELLLRAGADPHLKDTVWNYSIIRTLTFCKVNIPSERTDSFGCGNCLWSQSCVSASEKTHIISDTRYHSCGVGSNTKSYVATSGSKTSGEEIKRESKGGIKSF